MCVCLRDRAGALVQPALCCGQTHLPLTQGWPAGVVSDIAAALCCAGNILWDCISLLDRETAKVPLGTAPTAATELPSLKTSNLSTWLAV